MKSFLIICIATLCAQIGLSQEALKRIEITKIDADNNVQKKVIIVPEKEVVQEILQQSNFPENVQNALRNDLNTLNNKPLGDYSFSNQNNQAQYRVEVLDQKTQTATNLMGPIHEGTMPPMPAKAYLGVRIKPLLKTENAAIKGVVIEDIVEGEAAYNAGLQQGDILFSLNELETPSPSLFYDALAQIAPRENVLFTFYRNNQKMTAQAIAGLRQNNGQNFNFPRMIELLADERPVLGIGLDPNATHPMVTSISEDSPAEKAGFKVGDEIVAVNDQDVATKQALIETLKAYKVGDKVDVTIKRNGETKTLEAVLTHSSALSPMDMDGQMFFFDPEQLNSEELLEKLQPLMEQSLNQLLQEQNRDK